MHQGDRTRQVGRSFGPGRSGGSDTWSRGGWRRRAGIEALLQGVKPTLDAVEAVAIRSAVVAAS